MRPLTWLMLALLLWSRFGADLGPWCLDGCCTSDGEAGTCEDGSYPTAAAACAMELAERIAPEADCAGSYDECCHSFAGAGDDAPIPQDLQVQQIVALESEARWQPEADQALRQIPLVACRGRDPPWPQIKATVELLI